jgi:1-acyl-sn-glycerol-3-phosphate acyltransferase
MARTPDHLKMTPFYGIFDYAIHGIYEAFFRGEVVGLNHIPDSGPFLIAANHASHLDPPVIGCQIPRQMRFFARKTLWNSRVGNWWMTSTECIPVDRDTGDVGAIRKVLQALQADRAVVLFPEGTRSPDGTLQKPKAGVGLMACKTGVAVVPARVFNSHAAFGKGDKVPNLGTPISIVFGAPLTAAEYDDPSAGKERYQIASERIFARIAALQEPVRNVI